MFTDAVILAGGFGERLWPASKPEYPKQFLSLEGGISFLQASVLRAAALELEGSIIIITRADLLELAANQCRQLTEQTNSALGKKLKENLYIIAEPVPRHTTAPVILACHFLEKIKPQVEHSIIVLTSDHVINPAEAFVKDCQLAYEQATNNRMVCFAIPPTEPATGFGYIKGQSSKEKTSFPIIEFKEKPDLETAKTYLKNGNYWWNSGMFAFTSNFFQEELEILVPQIHKAFLPLKGKEQPVLGYFNGIKYVERWDAMEEAYKITPAISIDKAMAEKTNRAWAIKASFSWDDVGSWDAFEKLFSENQGNTTLVNSNNCFVYSDIPVALCGVDDLIVVIKNGNALVMKKGSSTLVREAAQKMNSR
ncbi:MAG: mannose-1-phosphate guanylyltransferase [Spirochaetaceae bacterium]|nr:mannose-1-phosphate guanylyltransferase [Spirochaetaceae bacterium]